MARILAADMDKYGGSNNSVGYFSLKNDKDCALVRFMYNDIEDASPYVVHQIEIDGRKRYVNCLREYNQPVDDCPLCRARYNQIVKMFILLYDVDEEKVKIWERGRKFYPKMSSICARYGNPALVSRTFTIERNGKAGDQTTTYEIYPEDKDNTTLEDLPEVPEVIGTKVWDKSKDDLEFFVEAGKFPPTDNEPVRRRNEEPVIRRRTPSKNSENIDRF